MIVIVPQKATGEMLDAALEKRKYWFSDSKIDPLLPDLYETMVMAAPDPCTGCKYHYTPKRPPRCYGCARYAPDLFEAEQRGIQENHLRGISDPLLRKVGV